MAYKNGLRPTMIFAALCCVLAFAAVPLTVAQETTGVPDEDCLGCHDNITAVIPGENERISERMQRWKTMRNHPIGMTYSTRSHRRGNSFNMPMTLDSSIRFFDGRVGCGSCHNPYAKTEMFLVIATEHGELCFSCHQG